MHTVQLTRAEERRILKAGGLEEVGERGDRGCGGGKADVAVLAVNWLLPFLFFSQFKLLHYNRKTVVRSPRLSGSIRNQPFLISIQGTRKLVVN
jgi:hypothetical protein